MGRDVHAKPLVAESCSPGSAGGGFCPCPKPARNAGTQPVGALTSLRATDGAGAAYVLPALFATVGGLTLAAQPHAALWGLGQILVAVAFTQWFCLLHEAGHGTLFRTRGLNEITGHAAGFFALIPFRNWKRVHALHHRWTGWQDVDPTTEGLSRKPANRTLIRLANVCWRWWLPLFSVVYRLANYWHLPRLRRILSGPPGNVAGCAMDTSASNKSKCAAWRVLAANAVVLAVVYAVLIAWLGPVTCLRLAGVGILAGLIFQDVLLLSQHTHIPQHLSRGEPVRAFSPREQELFTRSLRFPAWFSRWVLVHSDAHELHHIHPHLPGYRLRQVPYQPRNEASWWRWTLAARRIPAEVFLYQNRNETGFDI